MKKASDLQKSDKYIVGITALCALVLFSWLVYDIAFLNPMLEGQVAIGKIYEVQNRVKRKFNRSLIWYAADQNETVYENDWIFTGSQSVAKIKLDSGGEIIVEPDSLIVLSRKNGVLQLDLQHGKLLADIKRNDIKINVIKRNGDIEAVQTSIGPIRIEQANNEVPVEELDVDKDDDGEEDLTISEVSDQENYDAIPGYSDINEHGLSYKIENKFNGELVKGQTAKVPLKWIDPFNRWASYEVEVASDPNFKNKVDSYTGKKPHFDFKTAQNGDLHWRIRGYDKNGKPSLWTGPIDLNVNINHKKKLPPVRLAREKVLYQMQYQKLQEVAADRSYKTNEDEPITVAWEQDQDAKQYNVQISDTKDFSNILEEKIIKETSLDLDNIRVGTTYFRVIPQTEDGFAIAEPAKGEINTYFPPPNENSLKTLTKNNEQVLSWDAVPLADAYQVTYRESKDSKKEIVKYVTDNQLTLKNNTGFLQWRVRIVDPETKKPMSSNSVTVDWYDAAKRLASLHGSGQAGSLYPQITKPEPRKTFISSKGSPIFMVMNWTYKKKAPSYEVEISKDPKMRNVILSKTITDGKQRAVINQPFPAGVYYMRVRAKTKDITQEAWSEVEVFRVIHR